MEHVECDPSFDDFVPSCPIMSLAWQTMRNTVMTNIKIQTDSLVMGRRAGNDDSSSLDSGLQVKYEEGGVVKVPLDQSEFVKAEGQQ